MPVISGYGGSGAPSPAQGRPSQANACAGAQPYKTRHLGKRSIPMPCNSAVTPERCCWKFGQYQ
eukprot:2026503-Alexandrium_andersonii.AAC.1